MKKKMVVEEIEEEEIFKDVKGAVDLRSELGQSDLDIIYDKFSHSNPLFEHEEGDFQDLSERILDGFSGDELGLRKKYVDDFKNGRLAKQFMK